MEKEKKNTFIQQNTIFGLFIGVSFILASYVFYKTGRTISINPQLNNVVMLLSIAGAFIGVKKYRDDNHRNGYSYASALGACMYMISVAAVIYGIYIYTLYQRIPGLQENYVTMVTTVLEEVYKGSPLLENMKTMIETFMTPAAIAFAEVFNKIFTGFIFSLLLAGILRRPKRL